MCIRDSVEFSSRDQCFLSLEAPIGQLRDVKLSPQFPMRGWETVRNQGCLRSSVARNLTVWFGAPLVLSESCGGILRRAPHLLALRTRLLGKVFLIFQYPLR